MIEKPTYEELERRVKELEKVESENKQDMEILPKDESRYRTLFEAANDSLFIMEDYRFVECNKMTLKMFGCEKEKDVLGSYPWDFSPPNQPDGSASKEKSIALMEASLGGNPQRFYWKHIKQDSREFDAEVSLNVLKTEEKTLLLAIVRDITDRKQTEHTLREREERYRELTEFLPIAIFETDDQGNVIYANPSALRSTGFTQKDIDAGLNMLQIIAPQDHNRTLRRFQQVMQGGLTDGSEYLIQRKDGNTFPGFINTRPSQHKIPGLMGYIFDLTSLRKVEKALQESEAAARVMLNSTTDIALLTEPDGTIVSYNENLPQSLGIESEGIIGKKISDLIII